MHLERDQSLVINDPDCCAQIDPVQHINTTDIHDPPTIDPRIADLRWGKTRTLFCAV
jgi:hypothetical protein